MQPRVGYMISHDMPTGTTGRYSAHYDPDDPETGDWEQPSKAFAAELNKLRSGQPVAFQPAAARPAAVPYPPPTAHVPYPPPTAHVYAATYQSPYSQPPQTAPAYAPSVEKTDNQPRPSAPSSSPPSSTPSSSQASAPTTSQSGSMSKPARPRVLRLRPARMQGRKARTVTVAAEDTPPSSPDASTEALHSQRPTPLSIPDSPAPTASNSNAAPVPVPVAVRDMAANVPMTRAIPYATPQPVGPAPPTRAPGISAPGIQPYAATAPPPQPSAAPPPQGNPPYAGPQGKPPAPSPYIAPGSKPPLWMHGSGPLYSQASHDSSPAGSVTATAPLPAPAPGYSQPHHLQGMPSSSQGQASTPSSVSSYTASEEASESGPATIDLICRLAFKNRKIMQTNLYHFYEALQTSMPAHDAWAALRPVLSALRKDEPAAFKATLEAAWPALSKAVAPAYLKQWLAISREGQWCHDCTPVTNLLRVEGVGPGVANPQALGQGMYAENGAYFAVTETEEDKIVSMACIAEGILAVGSVSGMVSVWSTAAAKPNDLYKGELHLLATFCAHSCTPVTAIAALPMPVDMESSGQLEEPMFLTCSAAGTVKAWSLLRIMNQDQCLDYSVVQEWALKMEGPISLLAVASPSAAGTTWAITTHATPVAPAFLHVSLSQGNRPPIPLAKLELPAASGPCKALALNAEGTVVLYGLGSTIHVWQVCPCQPLATLTDQHEVTSLAVGRDGLYMLSGSTPPPASTPNSRGSEASIKLWKLKFDHPRESERVKLKDTTRGVHQGGVKAIVPCMNDGGSGIYLSCGDDCVKLHQHSKLSGGSSGTHNCQLLPYMRGGGLGLALEGSKQKGWRIYMTTPAGRALRIYSMLVQS